MHQVVERDHQQPDTMLRRARTPRWPLVATAGAAVLTALVSPSPMVLSSLVVIAAVCVAQHVTPDPTVEGAVPITVAVGILALAEGGLPDGEVSSWWHAVAAIATYPMIGRWLLQQGARYRQIRSADLIVEAVLVGSAVAIVLQFGIDRRMAGGGTGLIASALPAMLVGLDVALLVVSARSLSERAARHSALGLATASVVVLFGAHVIAALRLAIDSLPGLAPQPMIVAVLIGLGVSATWTVIAAGPPMAVVESPLFSNAHAGVVVVSLLAAPAILIVHSIEGVTVSTTVTTGIGVIGTVLSAHLIAVLRERAAGEHQATHDPLTDLPNRVLFMDRVERALAHASRNNQPVALLYIDLDRFKDINDTMGHRAGDELLRETAARLSSCLRHEDTVARLAGDEFGVLLPHVANAEDSLKVAQRILGTMDEPVQLGDLVARNHASIGVAVFPNDAQSPTDLMAVADTTMYLAKEAGGGCFRVFSADLAAEVAARVETETALYNAIEQDELVLHYQPILDAADGRVIGAEALVRWQHPTKGLLPPGQFIPIAEESDLIVLLGKWVIREACRELARWSALELADHYVSINVSAKHFRHDLVSTITEELRVSGASAQNLVIELTESTAADDVEVVAERLHELRALGVRAVIDDFGTGFCGLQYLGDLPVAALKLDRSFVLNMTPRAAAIVAATIALGHSLGMSVVAEGVETADQQRFLTVSGCDHLQGFFLGRPMPALDMRARLDQDERRPRPEETAAPVLALVHDL